MQVICSDTTKRYFCAAGTTHRSDRYLHLGSAGKQRHAYLVLKTRPLYLYMPLMLVFVDRYFTILHVYQYIASRR